ncbi:MAG: flagellar biosynthesis anti-sigma factor FlgM [Salinispira sp.]
MSIEGLGPLDPVSPYKKNQKPSPVDTENSKDSISLSAEAKHKAEMLKTSEEVHMAPDIREDRIAEVREKLKDPSYINKAVIDEVAEKILNMFKI